MKELLQYIRAKQRKDEPAILEEMKQKFKDKDVEDLINKLMIAGMIWQPRLAEGKYRSLD